ncbi:MAG TPA: hydroxyacid dehydrogenase [Propionibacteriaceae bacterium]
MTEPKPVVILRPAPQRSDRIFTPAALARLEDMFEVHLLEGGGPEEEARFEELLPRAYAIVGQPDLPAERLARAPELRAVLNVEGNFFPNVDYRGCHERGIYVLGCGPAYATAVAEYAIGLALDLARGISREDRAFREGRERYVSDSTADSILLSGSEVGLIGFGNLGRAIHRLLASFRCGVRVFDPWLPDSEIIAAGATPASLAEVLSESQFTFVLATVTPESEHLLGDEELAGVRQGARLVLVSRAAVVDYDALLAGVRAGRFLAAVDVWPTEPMPADHEARGLEGLVLSAHRAGGIPEAFFSIGDLVADDLSQISRGLPPVRMQVASLELVHRYRNRPVT